MYNITLIPGDGTGPEISEATKRVIEATGVSIQWDIQDAGIDVYEKEGTPLLRHMGVARPSPNVISGDPRLSPEVPRA